MDSFENFVFLLVLALACLQSFNDPSVITIDLDSHISRSFSEDCLDEELHPDSFCPGDISPVNIPPRFERPCPPVITDDNSNSNT